MKSTITLTSSFSLILFLILLDYSSQSSFVQEIVSSQNIVSEFTMILMTFPFSNSVNPMSSQNAESQNTGYEVQMRETIMRHTRLMKNHSERILVDSSLTNSKVKVMNSFCC